MDGILGWIVVAGIGWWFFNCGKRAGSELGFRAGRRRTRRRR